MDVVQHKPQLRDQIHAQVAAVSPVAMADAVRVMGECFLHLPEIQAAERIAFFAPLPDELPIAPLAAMAWQQGKVVCFPRVVDRQEGRMEFACVARWSDLQPGAYGILEPSADALAIASRDIDCVVVPGLAYTRDGARLGRGAGFYDRFLAGFSGVRIGLALACQIVPTLPADSWDEWVHIVVTENEIIRCREQ